MRKLIRVDLLILDDFALQPLDALDTADVYELIVERHRAASTVVTSNREPIEWLGQMADALLAQSAIDRLQSAAYELVLDGESYRQAPKTRTQRRRNNPTTPAPAAHLTSSTTRHHHHANAENPRSGPIPLANKWSHQAGGRQCPCGDGVGPRGAAGKL